MHSFTEDKQNETIYTLNRKRISAMCVFFFFTVGTLCVFDETPNGIMGNYVINLKREKYIYKLNEHTKKNHGTFCTVSIILVGF